MTKLKLLNLFLTERLAAAAKEIFIEVENTLIEYQEEISRSKAENDRLRGLLDIAFQCTQAQQPIQCVESGEASRKPEQCEQEWNLSLGQEDQEPTHTESIFTPSCGKHYNDQELPQSANIYQIQTVELRDRDCLSSSNNMTKTIKLEPEREGFEISKPICPQSYAMNLDIAVAPSEKDVYFNEIDSDGLPTEFEVPQPNRQRSARRGQRKCPTKTLKKNPEEKPYQCNVCGKSFQHMSKLRSHLRVHTGERPFSCPECGKCFSQSGEVNRHLKTHTRQRAYLSGL